MNVASRANNQCLFMFGLLFKIIVHVVIFQINNSEELFIYLIFIYLIIYLT